GGQSFAAGATVYWGQDGTFLGATATGAAASLLVNADGSYTYTLLDNLLLGTDTQGEQIDTLATVSITGKDADGDTQAVSVTLKVQDDVPALLAGEAGADTVTVEDEKASGGIDEADGGLGSVDGSIVNNVNWGADGFGSATTFS
ncbi:VCBS domain-containing protein, partial [Aromatoleum evansii]